MLCSDDAELVRRDRNLPGLSTLLDPEAFLDALRPSLPKVDLQTGEITYLRYKPGTNMLAAYRLTTSDVDAKVYAKAHRPSASVKLYKAMQRPSLRGPLGPGCIVLADRAIEIVVFPNDNKIRALRRLTDPVSRHRRLSRILPERPELWESTLKILRYKPERRFVAQLLTGNGHSALLKTYAE